MQNLMICSFTTMFGGLVKARYWSVFGHYGKSWKHFCWIRRVQKQNNLWNSCRMKKMEIVAFLSDITSHLNMKLQGKNDTVCNLTQLSVLFRRNCRRVFKCDLQQDLLHFPKLINQTARKHHHHNHAEFLDKLIENFQTRFGDFPLGNQVLQCSYSALRNYWHP